MAHIDLIARQKQRDVLYVTFRSPNSIREDGWSKDEYDWHEDPMYNLVRQWLTDHHIPWKRCGPIASERFLCCYQGYIYLDVLNDINDPNYQLICNYLEHPDGTRRFPTVIFGRLSLSKAMENAHHDEPGFWDNWAENL